MYQIWKNGKIIPSPYSGLYAGIITQGVFGRMDCPGGKQANKKNRRFYFFWEDCLADNLRPCKRCNPDKILRRDCDHMPFGLTGGLALALKESKNDKIKVTCFLCNKLLGYAKKLKAGRIKWHDGFIIPRTEEEIECLI